MQRNLHKREKKSLSMSGLLKVVRKAFDKIPSNKKVRKITLSDAFMSALAMFSLKSPSLLAFENDKTDPVVEHNLKTLFGVKKVPSDTHMRELLDEISPDMIRQCFLDVFHELQRGKVLERYEFLNTYLCLIDGTEIFNSEQVHCNNCCQKHHKDGRITYHHQLLGAVIAKPGVRQVLPLCPEPIQKRDGATKNDCERNATHRFLCDLKREHPRLKLTLVSDALSATAPHVNELKSLGYDFIIVAKKDGNRSLFEWTKGSTKEITMKAGRNRYVFRYVNNVPLNNTKDAPEVNFLECEALEINGKKEHNHQFAWITSHEITEKNAYTLMLGGRSRWKVENETFNTLKNQDYQFEHNFGHGKKNLHTVFAFLMMLVFLLDQAQEAACGLFQTALNEMKSKRALWHRMRSFFYVCLIQSWADLFKSIHRRFQGVSLDTS